MSNLEPGSGPDTPMTEIIESPRSKTPESNAFQLDDVNAAAEVESSLESSTHSNSDFISNSASEKSTDAKGFYFPNASLVNFSVRELIYTRIKAILYAFVASTPLLFLFVAFYFSTFASVAGNYKSTGKLQPNGRWVGQWPNAPAENVGFAILSAWSFWITDAFAFSVSAGDTKRNLLNKFVVIGSIIYFIGQAFLQIGSTLNFWDETTAGYLGYFFPLLPAISLFYGIKASYKRISNNPFSGFIFRAMIQTVVFLIMLYAYSQIVIILYFSTSDFGTRLLIRFIVHPLIMEITLLPWRLLTIWCHARFAHLDSWFELLIPQFFFLFTLIGRFMVAATSNIFTSIFIAALLSLQDQLFRTSMLHRDRAFLTFFLRLFNQNVDNSLILNTQHKKLYAHWILFDELSELVSIFISPFLVFSLRISDNENGSFPSILQLLLLTFLSLVFEYGSDIARLIYYATWTPPDWMLELANSKPDLQFVDLSSPASSIPSSPFVIKMRKVFAWIGYRSARFWNSIEFAIHEATLSQHPKFYYITSFYFFFVSIYVIQAMFLPVVYFSFNPKNDSLFLFFK